MVGFDQSFINTSSAILKTIVTLLLLVVTAQTLCAWARYYDGESAAFVFVNEARIVDLSDGNAVLTVALRPPATWMGVTGHKQIQVSGFPIQLLDKIKQMKEPAFLVFYSDRAKLTDRKGETPDTVKIGGPITYSVGILTSTNLVSPSGGKIALQADVVEWIEAYRKILNQDDLKVRDFYLKLWASN